MIQNTRNLQHIHYKILQKSYKYYKHIQKCIQELKNTQITTKC